ncbi:hypothetical protein AVEN_3503-1 [Araneus ventricosus]|uniref:Uncharacterized protein n=1 Tax=Araneus ventricosus TaxID=182803 RepID=A0A4Y2JQW3_ARAVE|nr:hypothetical protein AVEN_3503-1 [Araneus ventricosus]
MPQFYTSNILPPGGTTNKWMRSRRISKWVVAPGRVYSNGGSVSPLSSDSKFSIPFPEYLLPEPLLCGTFLEFCCSIVR